MFKDSLMTFQYTETIQKPHLIYFHKVFSSLYKKNSHFYLLLALTFWFIFPILGVVPLLIFCQMKVSRDIVGNRKVRQIPPINLFILLIILFTITVISSTYPVVSDLLEYVKIFDNLSSDFFLEKVAGRGMEPLSYLLPYFLKTYFHIHSGQFILLQSFTLNFAFIFISTYFLPNFYPTSILLNIVSNSYFLQIFIMRQYYSYIFLVPCIFSSKLWVQILFAVMAYYTHRSSILFSIPIIIFSLLLTHRENYKKSRLQGISQIIHLFNKYINKFIRNKLFLLILAIFIPFLFLRLSGNLFGGFLAGAYSSYEIYSQLADSGYKLGLNDNLWRSSFFSIVFIVIGLFMIKVREVRSSGYLWIVCFMLSLIFLIAFYFGFFLFGRLVFFLTGLSGFFFSCFFLPNRLDDSFQRYSHNKGKSISLLIILFVIVQSSYFFYRSTVQSASGASDSFGTGLLEMNLFDYFNYLYDYFIRPV
jgi:hypothetical protein